MQDHKVAVSMDASIYPQTLKLQAKAKSAVIVWLASLASLCMVLRVAPALATKPPMRLSQTTPIEPQATQAARIAQKQAQLRQIRIENYDLRQHPITDAKEKHWRNILWTTAIVEPQEPFVAQALGNILLYARNPGLSASQRRTVNMAFQVGTQLYLNHPNAYGNLGQKFVETVEASSSPGFVAMALSGLARSSPPHARLQTSIALTRQRFPQWSQNVTLRTTLADVNEKIAPVPVPPLRDLLNWAVAPGQLQMFAICGRDRTALCTAILKDRQGQFVKEGDRLWSTPLLLRSLHGLGWNFTRGDTPQGIYRIEGVVPQPDSEFFRAFGRFPLVNLYVPFEPGAKSFLPGRAGTFAGNLKDYESMLPPSWRNYAPIQQTYWAGYLGRGLFRIHGSGEDPSFFSKLPRDGAATLWNPTIGCLSALEVYDKTGRLQQADMPKILNALTAAGGKNFSGYLTVVEVPQADKDALAVETIEAAMR
ncbi:hypothetical protein [Altericista sp. CCNU0014]|uniref:hypothetical protein n=1 Tax=Altericista sp. CCNU0014 TaxID=3082949 RepID=UPI00384C565B